LIPAVHPTSGFLPLGAHFATLADVHQRFVSDAPHEARRQQIFDALVVYFDWLRALFPTGLALVDGGFTTHKLDAPHDVDVVIFPDDPTHMSTWTEQQFMDFQGLMTLQDVIVGGQDAAYFKRIQPLAGLLDGFIAAPEREQMWRRTWSSVRGAGDSFVPDQKGYLEVRW